MAALLILLGRVNTLAKSNELKILERIADSLQDIKFDLRRIFEQGQRIEGAIMQLGSQDEDEDQEEPDTYQTL